MLRRLDLFAALAAGAACLPSQTPAPPADFAVYYGWPTAVNGAWNTAAAAAVFAAYERVVLGDGLQSPAHPDHVNTVAIVAAAPQTEFFGYVPLGQLGGGLTESEIAGRIDAWRAVGVRGIFLDEAGYDYGVTRSLQNAVVRAVHSRQLSAWINAWQPADVFAAAPQPLNAVGGGNPGGLPCELGPGDRYLLESYQIENGNYQGEAWFVARSEASLAYRQQFGTKLDALTTTTTSRGFAQDRLDYAWCSALLYGLDGFGWGEPDYSAASARLPWRPRPSMPALGTQWLPSGVIHAPNLSLLHRLTDRGQVRLDTLRHTGAFCPAELQGPSTAPVGTTTALLASAHGSGGREYIGIASAALGGTPLSDGRVFPLAPDGLSNLSLLPGNPFFLGFQGTLDAAGQATLSVAMPHLPGLAGFSFHVAFLVLDPAAPQRVRTFSQARTLTVR